jgi:phosphopantothenoylcysteine decarboxylase/phosphopantothenate--cysteine ligase
MWRMRSSQSLRFLVTAGPTREFLDPIRFVSNRSSGKMGYALAEAARATSPQVILVSGPTALTPPAAVECIPVTTAQDMADAVLARFDRCDVVIMAAAVCDFRPRQTADSKIRKGTFRGVLELEPTVDILAELGKRKESQTLVGFAAETDDLVANAHAKLQQKNLDMIVANTASAFEAETNAATLLFADGRIERLPELRKLDLAMAIIERVLKLRT